jgi:hypothetical protein
VKTGPLDVLRLLARDPTCEEIMGFGAFQSAPSPNSGRCDFPRNDRPNPTEYLTERPDMTTQ